MTEATIPEAIAADLQDLFNAAPPAGASIPAARVRVKNEMGDLPSPRLVILAGEPRAVPKMNGTARVPVVIEYITNKNAVQEQQHAAASGALDAWFRSLATSKRRSVIVSRVHLHDLIPSQAVTTMRESEQVTLLRADLVVTLCG